MRDLPIGDWLEYRFDEAVDALDRVVTTPPPLSRTEFRRRARRSTAGRSAPAIGAVVGTVAALAFAARDASPTTPATPAPPNTTQARITTAGTDDQAVDLDRLMYPTDSNVRVVEALTSPSIEGRFNAVVLDPDGVPWTVSVAEDFWHGQTPPDAEQRDIDGLTFETHLEAGHRVYTTSNQCALLALRGPHRTTSAWTDRTVALLSAVHVREGSISVALPTGWTALGQGPQPGSYNLRLDVDIDGGGTRSGVLYQSLDATLGSLLAEHQPSTADPIDVNGRTGWVIEQYDTAWTYLGWQSPNGAALLAVENTTASQLRSLIGQFNTGHADAWIADLGETTLATTYQPVPTTGATPLPTGACDRTLEILTPAVQERTR